MGQVRHGSATTTHAVRAAIQRSQASLATLSRELGINPKTVAKWRKRQTVDDLKTGPKEPRSTVLTEAEEAAIVAFRRHTLLPLDDCLYAFTSNEEAHAGMDALKDPLNERLPKEAGVRVLGYFEKGFRVLTNSEREVKTMNDLKDLKIRVSKNNIAIETFKSWGLDPIPMAWAEVFSALQQGVIDGQENPYTTAISSKFYEVQKYITEIHYLIWSGPIIVSERFYQGLPEDLQQALDKAGVEAAQYEREVSAEETEAAKEKLVELGMTLTGAPEDEVKWQEAAKALWPQFAADIGGAEWVEEATQIMTNAIAT